MELTNTAVGLSHLYVSLSNVNIDYYDCLLYNTKKGMGRKFRKCVFTFIIQESIWQKNFELQLCERKLELKYSFTKVVCSVISSLKKMQKFIEHFLVDRVSINMTQCQVRAKFYQLSVMTNGRLDFVNYIF